MKNPCETKLPDVGIKREPLPTWKGLCMGMAPPSSVS